MRVRCLAEAARAMNGELRAAVPSADVHGASIDSRRVRAGDIFFALRGARTHGRAFVASALSSGAAAAVLARDDEPTCSPSVSRIVVEDPVDALGRLAAAVREDEERTVPAAAITGSVGKTTTCRYAATLLAGRWQTVSPQGSFNNHLGVPLTILNAPSDMEILVAEIGSSAPGEVLPLARCVRPRVVCVTAVAPVHLAGFGSIGGVLKEKLSIVEALPRGGTACLPVRLVSSFRERYPEFDGELITFGAGGDVWIDPQGTENFAVELRSGKRYPFRWRSTFAHDRHNLEAALAVSLALGGDAGLLIERIPLVTPPRLRGEVRVHGGVELLLDCYNSNPLALDAAIAHLATAPAHGRRFCVIGTMEELGEREREWHERAGRRIARHRFDGVYVAGRGRDWILSGLRAEGGHGVLIDGNVEECASRIAARLHPGDRMLFKASRHEALEQLAEKIAHLLDSKARD